MTKHHEYKFTNTDEGYFPMNKARSNLAKTAFFIATIVPATGLLSVGSAYAAGSFEKAGLRLEQNFTDRDVEIVFDVVTGGGGITALQVKAPDGRVVIDFKSPASKFGIRHLELETPEPANNGQLQADFPAGAYRFDATVTTGHKLHGEATLSHALPAAPTIVSPEPEQEDVPLVGAQVRWKPMPGIDHFVVVLEHEKSGRAIKTTVPGTVNTFSVPAGFLIGGTEHKVEIGAVAMNGNRTFVEHEFKTAKR